MELKQLIKDMCGLMSVSGNERRSSDALTGIIGEAFDEHYIDAVGNQIYVRRCGKPDAARLLVDTHFDEIGMAVTGILDGGFLRMTNIGGVDTRILESAEVTVYGKQKFNAVIAAVPAHKRTDADALTPLDELLVDTGYTKEWLDANVPLGTPVGFRPIYTDLQNDRLVGKAFDDKACGACAVYGISQVAREDMAGDVYCLFSVQEERGMLGGMTGAESVGPDAALIMDVCHASTPDAPCTMSFEDGVLISHSALTSRKLTHRLIDACGKAGIKFKECAEATGTGTNANLMGRACEGIPTVLVSMPVKSMHSSNEALSLRDAEELARTVSLFIGKSGITEGM